MAKLKNGLAGSFSGKIGDLVGFELNGKQYVKRKAVRTTPASEKELVNRFVFELVQNWVKPLKDIVQVGFKNYAPTYEGVQAAFSQVYREALIKDDFNSFVDPSLVKMSTGSLELSEAVEIVYSPEEWKLNFTWNPVSGINKGHRDRVLLVAYNSEEEAVYCDLCGPRRGEGSAQLLLLGAPKGIYHVYVGFVSEDRNSQSDSNYLGHIVVI